jgi:hypothetical protein
MAYAVDTAKDVMLTTGQHHPQLIVDSATRVQIVALVDLPADWDERWRMLRQAGRKMARQCGSLRSVCFAAEAWFTTVKREEWETDRWLRPSSDPARKECLVVTGRDLTAATQADRERVHGYIGEILRIGGPEGKVVDLVPMRDASMGTDLQSNLLDEFIAGWLGSSQ